MSYVVFVDEDGSPVTASAANPLPVTSVGGSGGLSPEDITANPPATWDAETKVIGVDVATVAVTGSYSDLTDTPKADFVANADGTDTTTLAASVDALRDALIAAGLMAASEQ